MDCCLFMKKITDKPIDILIFFFFGNMIGISNFSKMLKDSKDFLFVDINIIHDFKIISKSKYLLRGTPFRELFH